MNSSLEELLDRWGDRLYRTALAILANPQDAEDAVPGGVCQAVGPTPEL